MRFSCFGVMTYCAFALLVFSACSHRDSIQTFNTYYYGAQEEKALAHALDEAGSGDVLWNLQAGVAGFETQSAQTHEILESGEVLFSQYEQEGLLGGVLDNVGAVVVNENIKDYRGNVYEGVMFHYYKALNAMSLGNYALARVEFNRANDRQRRAKDYFHEDVQKALQKTESEGKKEPALQDPQAKKMGDDILAQYSNLTKLGAYQGFINPSVSYVSALFFMLEGDYAKATDLYKESFAISKSPTIKKDLEIMQERKRGKGQKYTWLIIEDGASAHKEGITLNVPLVIDTSVVHMGISLPVFVDGKIGAKTYQIHTPKNPSLSIKATEIGNMDMVIANEFAKQLPLIVTRAVTSAIVKTTTQLVLAKNLGSTGILVGLLYSMATNATDIRISTALPKRMLALQIPNDIGNFSLYADHKELYKISFQCFANESKQKKHHNLIVICPKNDNILHLRAKGKHSNYRILKGGLNE